MLKGVNLWQIQSQFLVAIQYGDLEKCASLLAAGADCDQIFRINSQNRTAISLAVERCAYSMVDLLIRSGSAINRQDTMGCTPLHIAVMMRNENICQLLIANRADVNVVDNLGETPLHIAAVGNSPSIVRLLISNGVDVNRMNHLNRTAFSNACGTPIINLEIIQILLESGGVVTGVDKLNYTPLSYLLQSAQYNYETVKEMVEKGARVDHVASDGKAPIHLIIRSNNPDKWKCLDLLLKHGCDLNILTDKKETPIHLTVLENDINSAKILIRANANVNTMNRLGLSPLLLAIYSGMTKFIDLLILAGAKVSYEDFKNDDRMKDISKQLCNPNSLKEISRVSVCKRFGPHTAEWIAQHPDQVPASLHPYLLFET